MISLMKASTHGSTPVVEQVLNFNYSMMDSESHWQGTLHNSTTLLAALANYSMQQRTNMRVVSGAEYHKNTSQTKPTKLETQR